MSTKFSVGIWALGPCAERFVPTGYRPEIPIAERFKMLSQIEDLRGVELHYPTEVPSIEEVEELSKKYNLAVVALPVHLFNKPKWKYGSLSAPDEKTRREAIELIKETMDVAKKFNSIVIIWPGQDGFDYPFQVDYREHYKNFVEGLKECCEYRPEVKIALEYKMTEPRLRILAGTIGICLTIVEDVGYDNLGINIDVGHALLAYENMAQAITLAAMKGKLFHIHLNDCFRRTDDDLIVGSVHFWETLELFYWLKEVKYDGWYSLDLFPYREDPIEAVRQSIENIKFFMKLVEVIDRRKDELREVFRTYNAIRGVRFLWSVLKEAVKES
ncbi:MAG: hypothetical protein DRJ49_00130 [Thermoprotei archaeon]|nr:MAG: hypothetical protein DRJ49_00130 [Thermoprotei archaeon]